MRSSSLFWGLILVLFGGLLLLQSLGILAINIWNIFWPLFLIAMGVWILVGRMYRGSVKTEQAVVALEGASRARVRIAYGAGRLDLRSGTPGSNLLEGTFTGGVSLDSSREADLLDVRLRNPSQAFPWFWAPDYRHDWSVLLHPGLPLALKVESGASEVKLDLTDLQVSELRLQTGASSASVQLPARAGMTRVDVETGAASVDLFVPSGVAAQIKARGGLSSISIDSARFPRQDGIHRSPDYDTAQNKVDISVEIGVGSLTVR